MNDLQYIDTLENGNSLLFFPCDGHLLYFERIEYSTIKLRTVDTLTGVEKTISEYDSFKDLPKSARKAIARSNYRMRSTKASFEQVMSHGD